MQIWCPESAGGGRLCLICMIKDSPWSLQRAGAYFCREQAPIGQIKKEVFDYKVVWIRGPL